MPRRRFSHKKSFNPPQNSVQRVRAELGLTQGNLADLLGVSRSVVSMDESGERRLPWPNVLLLEALQTALRAPPPPPDTLPPPALSAAARDDLDFRRQGLALEIYPLEQKLERAHLALAQARRWAQVLPALRAAFPATDANAHAWLDMFESQAALTEGTAGGPLAQLHLRRAVVAFELAEIARLLGEA